VTQVLLLEIMPWPSAWSDFVLAPSNDVVSRGSITRARPRALLRFSPHRSPLRGAKIGFPVDLLGQGTCSNIQA
jgi:hypothetical protein